MTGPRAFISFAAPDEAVARQLADRLRGEGIGVFVAPEHVEPGTNFVTQISRQLSSSDYFVVLISQAAHASRWVEEEWCAAVAREVRERRIFVFPVLLDASPMPGLLLARNYLDATGGIEAAAQVLADTWRRDSVRMREGVHPLPAPNASDGMGTGHPEPEQVGIYVFNQDLAVEHFLYVPRVLAYRQLLARVRHALDLKDRVDTMSGLVGLRFEYQLDREAPDSSIDGGERREQVCHLREGETLTLVVRVEPFGPELGSTAVTYRDVDIGSRSRTHSSLLRAAFEHLLPQTEVMDK